jgi:hypothetical protein
MGWHISYTFERTHLTMSSADRIIGIVNVVAQLAIAGIAIAGILAALHANKKQIASSESQLNKQIEENRRLATEERQHQSRPIIVPKEDIIQTTATTLDRSTGQIGGERFYTSDHTINWAYNHSIRIPLQNMGNGPAFNLHAVFYGSGNTSHEQFVSWDNGPIEANGSLDIYLEHSTELRLLHDESLDRKHPLYDRSLDSPENPWVNRIACLTLTYHDLFGKKYVSIYHSTLQHRWVHVATGEISGDGSFDLKELNDRKKQGLKLPVSLS